jgi:RNA polymerase sigma factor (sigma-70 family)
MATVAPEIPVLARDEAFEQLYRRHVKDVYHYALALMRNPADAEDVTQTTFLNAYRAFQRGEEIRKPQNWLIKIAHNVARSRYARTSRRVKEVPLEDHVDQLAIPEEEKPNVEGVLRALGRLPFNQRAALAMRELEGRSYAEIADTLGVSVAAVETLIFRARGSLRVRTAALRSLLAVPLPGSLTPVFGGGGAAAAGGIGAGMLIKAAVALVVGGLATGLGIEQGTRAVAVPKPEAAAPSAAAASTVTRQAVTRSANTRPTPVSRLTSRRVVRRVADAGIGPRSSSGQSATSQTPVSSSGQAAAAAPTPVSPLATPISTQPVEDAASSVEQTVSQVTTALPVTVPQVPQLPVQPPPLPKLP